MSQKAITGGSPSRRDASRAPRSNSRTRIRQPFVDETTALKTSLPACDAEWRGRSRWEERAVHWLGSSIQIISICFTHLEADGEIAHPKDPSTENKVGASLCLSASQHQIMRDCGVNVIITARRNESARLMALDVYIISGNNMDLTSSILISLICRQETVQTTAIGQHCA